MVVEELFAKLLTNNIGQIRMVYFAENSARLTPSQLSLFPQVKEYNWVRDGIELLRDDNIAYVLSMPSSGWPHEFNVEEILTVQSIRVYLLVPEEYIDDLGKLLISVGTPNIAIKSVSNFVSLSQDYALEVRQVKSFGVHYIAQSISELPFSKLQNSIRNTLIMSLNNELDKVGAEITGLHDEKAKLEKKIVILKDEKSALNEELLSSLNALKQLDSEHKVFKAAPLEERKEELTKLETGLRSEIITLKREFNNINAELVYHRNRHRQIKSSFSYRFGNIFARSAKSPKGIILLPFRVVAFLFDGFKKKLRRYFNKNRNKLANTSKNVADTLPAKVRGQVKTAPPVKTIDENAMRLANYLRNDELEEKWTAVISSDWLRERIEEYPTVHSIHPNTWPAMFNERLPTCLVVDSLDMLKNSPWLLDLEGAAYGYPGKLVELLEYCSSCGVETILWHSAPPSANRLVAEISAFFSKVLIADLDELRYLKDTYGIAEERLCYFTMGVDKNKMVPVAKGYEDKLPRVVVPEVVEELEVGALRAVYSSFLASANCVPADGSDGIVVGGMKEAKFGDFVMIPWYPKAKGYLPVELFLAIEKGCIPFTTSDSAVNENFAELVPVVENPDSLAEAFRPLLEETTTLSDWVLALRGCALEKFDLFPRLRALFEEEKPLLLSCLTQDPM